VERLYAQKGDTSITHELCNRWNFGHTPRSSMKGEDELEKPAGIAYEKRNFRVAEALA